MYKQFAVTIVVSVTISGVVALTLTPALCALILKPGHHEPNAFFRAFNRGFDKLTAGFGAGGGAAGAGAEAPPGPDENLPWSRGCFDSFH